MSDRSYNVGKYGNPQLLTLAPRRAATHTATRSGDWDDPETWGEDDVEVPGDGAAVLVPEGVTVTLSHRSEARLETVRVDGTLTFDTATDTKLRVDTLLVSKAGRLEIGTVSDPVDAGVTAEIEFLPENPIERPADPLLVGRGLLAIGECEIHGAPKTTWDALASHATAGDTSIRLSGRGPATQSDDGWQVGDEIAFPDQEPWGGVPEAVADDGVSPTATRDDEIREVTGVSGDTITFDEPLDVDHVPPESGLDSYVLNLSRNVRLFSESTDPDEYGHVMIMSTGQSIRYCETERVGRTDKKIQVSNPLWGRGESTQERNSNPRARYAIHFHRTGPAEATHTVQGCSIRDNPGWGVVNHDSSVAMLDNVSYDIDGCAFVTEKGTESGSFRRNFALRSVGSGEQVDSRKGWDNQHPTYFESGPGNIDDFAHHGGGFWMHSPIVETEDNVAAGHRAHGFFWHQRCLYEQPLGMENANQTSPDPGELLDGKHDMVPQLEEDVLTEREQQLFRRGDDDPPVGEPWHEPDDSKYFTDSGLIRQFDDNTAFACGAGVSFRSVSFRNEKGRFDWSELRGFTCYNVGNHYLSDGSTQGHHNGFKSDGNVGVDHRYVGNMTHVDYRLLGNGDGIGSSNNLQYTNGWDYEDSEIRGWMYGYIPKRYRDEGYNRVVNTVFDNDVDILLKDKFPRDESGLYLEDNEYNGDTTIEWQEPWIGDFAPNRSLRADGVVNFEGRNLYHGWSDPNFVLVEEGDDDRLDSLMNTWGDKWQSALGGDDPRDVLPGATSQDLYDEYRILFHGGLKDPNDEDAERPDGFVGSGGTYDTAPFLGPANKVQPCDEIWIDAVESATLSGDASVVNYEDGGSLQRHEALQGANDGSAVQLEHNHHHSNVPAEGDDGIAEFTFEIDRTGWYQVFTRGQTAGDLDDVNTGVGTNFYVRVDGGDWEMFDTGYLHGQTTFSWSRPDYVEYELTSTGEHTLEIGGLGQKMRLDWLLVCHETVAAAPLGKGKEATP